jgi:FAD/FMN-containing dehydrogenase
VVIGMKFATLEGKLVQTGGMVVKNVAGLDMAKLMIGSFGTLAAIAVTNFKLAPTPAVSRTFILSYPDLSVGHGDAQPYPAGRSATGCPRCGEPGRRAAPWACKVTAC